MNTSTHNAVNQPRIEPDNSEEKILILLNEAQIEFDRFISSIELLNSKSCTLFQIFLVIVTIEISSYGLFLYTNSSEILENFLILALSALIVIEFIIFFHIITPKPYSFPTIFKKSRIDELYPTNTLDIHLDLLFHIQTAYHDNQNSFRPLAKWFKMSIGLLIGNIIVFGILIFKTI